MIKVLDIIGIRDDDRIVVEYNRGSLMRSKVKVEGNGTLINEVKDGNISVSSLLLGGRRSDIDLKLPHDVVLFNSIGIAENHNKSISQFNEILKKVKNPVINPPESLLRTQRDSIYGTLSGIDGLLVPRCEKIVPRLTRDVVKFCKERKWNYPFLFRPVKEPENTALVRIDSEDDIETKLQRFALDGANAFYMTEFINFRSDDGFYRKVRFLIIGDTLLPRHLILSKSWKIHREEKDMSAEMQKRQREEEVRFLVQIPLSVGQRLRRIKEMLGLDYFGVDCAFDKEGRMIIFEANPYSMIGLGKDSVYHQGIIKATMEALSRLIIQKYQCR